MDKCSITPLDNFYSCSSNAAANETVQDEEKQYNTPKFAALDADDSWICAICLDPIQPEETAQIKGCGHNYCVTCILRWASYVANPWCPQCKHPFSSLFVYRALDGSMHDYMLEESICLLLRASWFELFPVQETYDEQDDYPYEDEMDEEYYGTSNVRLGNRRWGDSGYVRAGRKEARPVGTLRQGHGTNHNEAGSSSGRASKGKEISKDAGGRRALRAQKRDAAEKAAAAKHQKHLQKLGRKAW